MLSEEQTEQIKKQVIQQIESTFPEDKKIQAKEQIESMNSEQLEKFLEQNKIMRNANPERQQKQQCIFCLINSGQVSSYKLDENENATAILEINPISKAHFIVIPKEHLQNKKISKEIYSFAEKVSKKVRTKFNPKGIIFSDDNLFGHGIVNVIPIYKNETPNSSRHQAKKEDLEKIQKVLEEKPRKNLEKVTKKWTKKKTTKAKKTSKTKKNSQRKTGIKKKQWFPKRIP